MFRLGTMTTLVVCLLVSNAIQASASAADGIAASVPHVVRTAAFTARANPRMPLRLVVHLSYPQPQSVDAFLRAVNDPSSPEFGHYLSPGQFAAAFAPSPASYERVLSALGSAGFRVVGTYSNRKVVDVTGDARHVQAFFGTTIGTFRVGDSSFYANLTPARIPKSLQGA